jgi:hypothetical protein
MKNVKYEGIYPCMHDHSTRFYSLFQGEKLMDLLFISQMDEEMESRSER